MTRRRAQARDTDKHANDAIRVERGNLERVACVSLRGEALDERCQEDEQNREEHGGNLGHALRRRTEAIARAHEPPNAHRRSFVVDHQSIHHPVGPHE